MKGSAPGAVTVPPSLPSGRRSVLFTVRRLGDASAEEVADALGITVSGARQQLSALADDGLVAVAQRYGQACTSELDFIRAVLDGTRVERVSHIIEGARHCAYDIQRAR